MADISTIMLPNGDTYNLKDTTARENIPTAVSELTNDSNFITNTDNAYRAASIPMGQCDSTSTATVFTATVPGITELRDGVCVWLKNGVITSASGFTININNLGAKPCYSNMATGNDITPTNPTRETTIFNINYTMLLVYSTDIVDGGGWICYRGYDANTNTIGYQLRTNSTVMTVSDTARYYKIYFTSADGTQWVPASANSTNSATSAKTVNQRPIDPFGRIVYTSANTSYAAGANLAATTIWDQYALTLGYSFNRTGAALTLTSKKPVYIKCAPQSNGSAIIDADVPYVQDLPTENDGKIYIFLGVAYDATHIELFIHHPVYYHDGTGIRLWVGVKTPTKTSDLTNDSGYQTATEVNSLITAAIGDINSFDIEIVNSLPTTDIKDHSIYFVSKTGDAGDVYDEYMYINNTWELIGTTAVDLSGYVPTSRTINNKALSSDITLTASDVGALPDTYTSPQPDWQENDSTSNAYIQNRTHYKTSLGYVYSIDLRDDLYEYLEEIEEDDDYASAMSSDINKTYSYRADNWYYLPELDSDVFSTGTFADIDTTQSTSTIVVNGVEQTLTNVFISGDPSKLYCYNNNFCIYVEDYDNELYLTLFSNNNTFVSSISFNLPVPNEMFEYSKLDSKYLDGKLIAEGQGKYSEIFNGTEGKIASGEYSHVEGNGGTSFIQTALNGTAGSLVYYLAEDISSEQEENMTYSYGQYVYYNNKKVKLLKYDGTSAGDAIYFSDTLDENNDLNSAQVRIRYATLRATGFASHAEGSNTKASNTASHAEGAHTIASGSDSHAEGFYTTASGIQSHAEGCSTTASGIASHAEGYNTIANGNFGSHAEGYYTNASGTNGSHVEGYYTTASGQASHAEGYYTGALSQYQHVQGKYNIEDTANKYADIVGNGTKASARSNAYTLDWSGNGVYAGKVTVGVGPTNNMDVATKQYVDNSNITYSLSMTNNRITLTPSSGTATYVDLPVYNGGVS